ncbi:aminopeptidase P family protein [Acidaminobacter sp. JC074]|uniref:M24 family metallopeptidase n=1 Tax=Acidaminobacter sp. JC074 TaxID=2530199 RepID=UPI001F0F514B|nr:Xaa-Pro peptidase family protein [Acidaminobacter sp. JC074]MCH4886800.1 aminopeptidase P family protein [Acidaminobacter sp. JC074]
MNQSRLNRILEQMKLNNLDQIIITAPNSLYYLLDQMFHPGERMLALYINKEGKHAMIANALFPSAKHLDTQVLFYDDTQDPVEILKGLLIDGNFGVDKEWPSHFLVRLMKKVPNLTIEIGSVSVDTPRMMKDADEVKRMKHASKVNDQAMEQVVAALREKKYSEIELKKLIPTFYESLETHEVSFSPSVCYGENGAVPHHDSNETMPGEGAVLIDMGGRTDGYCSDMTRSFYYGQPTEEYRKVYDLVLEANLAGIAAVKPGIKIYQVDDASRKVIADAGYGDYFTHRTGHGIGIEVHEFPDCSGVSETVLEEGMTFTIEPGIYLEGKFGVRIEDVVLVTKDGCEVLNSYPKALQSL